jgi:uncharacterized Fe-S cluster protein YjdI
MKEITKKYSNGEVTVVWKPTTCIHSAICFRGLSSVFNPQARPWITPEGASTAEIIAQVEKCPSGALTYFMNNDVDRREDSSVVTHVVVVSPNGPLLVHGDIKVKDAQGQEIEKSNITAFCRCGASTNKPYCDGSHAKIGFEG